MVRLALFTMKDSIEVRQTMYNPRLYPLP